MLSYKISLKQRHICTLKASKLLDLKKKKKKKKRIKIMYN